MELNEWLGNIESTAHMLAEHGGVIDPLSLFPLTLDHDGVHEGQLRVHSPGSWRSWWNSATEALEAWGVFVGFFSLKMHPLLLPKIHTKTQLILSHLLFHHYSSLEYFQREKKTTYYFTVKKTAENE